MNSNQISFKTLYTELISIHDHINLKSKIKILEVHDNLPLITFSDIENNVMIFDVFERKPIRAFNISQYFQEQSVIKDLKFFNTNDRHYINNTELNEIKKMRGLPFNLRSSLLIITLEKSICFYSIYTNNLIKLLTPSDLEQRLPVKSELYNYKFLVIQTTDGSLIIWNLIDWTIHKILNKMNLGRPVVNFTIISTISEVKFIAIALNNGNLLMIDLCKKDGLIIKLDDKNEHDSIISSLDYSPVTNILASVSKNAIYLVDIKNIKNNKRISNFQYFKSEKISGIISNLNHSNLLLFYFFIDFSKYNYFIYGKTSSISSIELQLDLIKNKKLDSKDAKNCISSTFDLETQMLNKASDNKQFKIYTAKFLNHSLDNLILGTNKGVIILKFNILTKPEITPSNLLYSINDNLLYLYSIQNGNILEEHQLVILNNMEKLPDSKSKIIVNQVFDSKALVANTLNKYKINFSYDGMYMSTVDIINNIYTIFHLQINEELRYNCKSIKSGKCTGEIEWCPYDNIFAITVPSINQVSTKSHLASDKNKLSNYFRMAFSLNVFKIQDNTISNLYVIDDLPCHRLFGGHYIGVMGNFICTSTSPQEDLCYPGCFSKFTYNDTSGQFVLNFYNWGEKTKLDLYLSEEPKFILSSSDLQYMVIIFVDKYAIYQISIIQENFSLIPNNIYYHQINDAVIYENFVLIFLTDKGFYYQFLNEENSYPYKFFSLSDELNMHNLKVSKKFKEKSTLYNRKTFPVKILGVYENNLLYTCAFNQTSSKPIDDSLFKIIYLIIKKKYDQIAEVLIDLEKKYIKSVFSIFNYYFENNREIIKNIFYTVGSENLERFDLYNYKDIYIEDMFRQTVNMKQNKNKIVKHVKSLLVNYIENSNSEGIQNLYKLANENGIAAILCSKYIDPKTFLETMIKNNKNFESFSFNENYKMHEGEGDKILSYAFQRMNKINNK